MATKRAIDVRRYLSEFQKKIEFLAYVLFIRGGGKFSLLTYVVEKINFFIIKQWAMCWIRNIIMAVLNPHMQSRSDALKRFPHLLSQVYYAVDRSHEFHFVQCTFAVQLTRTPPAGGRGASPNPLAQRILHAHKLRAQKAIY